MKEYFVVMYYIPENTYDILEVEYGYDSQGSKYITEFKERHCDYSCIISMLNAGYDIVGVFYGVKRAARRYGIIETGMSELDVVRLITDCPHSERKKEVYNRTGVILQEIYVNGCFYYDLTYYDYRDKKLKNVKFKGGDRNYTVMAWNVKCDCRICNKKKVCMIDSNYCKSYAAVTDENRFEIEKARWAEIEIC